VPRKDGRIEINNKLLIIYFMSKPEQKEEKKLPNGLPENEADLQERQDNFNKELIPLLAKYELGLLAMPKILPDGRVMADSLIISVREQMKEEEAKIENGEQPVAAEGLTNPDA